MSKSRCFTCWHYSNCFRGSALLLVSFSAFSEQEMLFHTEAHNQCCHSVLCTPPRSGCHTLFLMFVCVLLVQYLILIRTACLLWQLKKLYISCIKPRLPRAAYIGPTDTWDQERPSPKEQWSSTSPYLQYLKGVSFLPLLISSDAKPLGMGWGQKREPEADDVRHV